MDSYIVLLLLQRCKALSCDEISTGAQYYANYCPKIFVRRQNYFGFLTIPDPLRRVGLYLKRQLVPCTRTEGRCGHARLYLKMQSRYITIFISFGLPLLFSDRSSCRVVLMQYEKCYTSRPVVATPRLCVRNYTYTNYPDYYPIQWVIRVPLMSPGR